jgi:hypothetical protein
MIMKPVFYHNRSTARRRYSGAGNCRLSLLDHLPIGLRVLVTNRLEV